MSARRRLLVLVASALALGVLLTLVVARVLPGLRGSDPLLDGRSAAPQSPAGPVLLVSGYGGGTGALQQLARRLRDAGREARVVAAVGDGTGDLHAQAEALDEAVDEQLRAGAASVDLVGYSAGGVVVRLWAAEHDGERKARRIVTLGSPHHGTEVASTAAAVLPTSCPEACQQLRRDSSLLAGLNRRDETPDGPRWTSIWTAADEVVTPPETARLDGAVNVALQAVCVGVRLQHGQLPTDPLPVGVVLQALGPGLDAPPPATACPTLRALGSSA